MSPPPTYESLIARFGERYRWLAMSVVATSIVAAVLQQGRALGQAAMIVSYARMLGGFFGIALLAGYVEARSVRLGGDASALAQAFGESFLLVATVLCLGVIAACRMRT